MAERIGEKYLDYFDQVFTCPKGHEVLMHQTPGFVWISFAPWHYVGKRVVGEVFLEQMPVLRETTVPVYCLTCPEKTEMHIQLRHRPDSKFRMYATIVGDTQSS
jgi:hypothetical protein